MPEGRPAQNVQAAIALVTASIAGDPAGAVKASGIDAYSTIEGLVRLVRIQLQSLAAITDQTEQAVLQALAQQVSEIDAFGEDAPDG